jgi:hypothetical protein
VSVNFEHTQAAGSVTVTGATNLDNDAIGAIGGLVLSF